MKLLSNRKIISKIALVILAVMLFQFVCPMKSVHADGIGGLLFEPVQQLVLTIFDAINWLMHKMFMGSEEILLTASVDKDYSSVFWKFATAVCVVGIGLVTFGVGTIAAVAALGVGAAIAASAISDAITIYFGDTVDLPMFSYSPYEIFSNQVPALSVNFFKPVTEYSVYEPDEGSESKYKMKKVENYDSPAYILRTIIAKWYVTFRNIAIVGLLSILVYIGIKITLSAPSEKARYKEMLLNWATAMCMLFILHYGMSIALSMTESMSGIVKSEQNAYTVNLRSGVDSDGKEVKKEYKIREGEGDGTTVDEWSTNLMGWIRMQAQLQTGVFTAFGYTVVYAVLVIYTVMFSITYLKRVVYMAFLTMIAPLIALTYPIDKAGDGKAQAFDSWTKEYIYNLIIQPVHLLLYTMLVSSAADIVSKNVIYALVVIGFMLPAEKLIRSFFGFKNDKTMGGLNAALGGAMAIRGLQSVGKMVGKASSLASSKSSSSDSKSDKSSEKNNSYIRMADSDNKGEDLTADAFGSDKDKNNPQLDAPKDNENQQDQQNAQDVLNGSRDINGNPVDASDVVDSATGIATGAAGAAALSAADDPTNVNHSNDDTNSQLARNARDVQDQIRISANNQQAQQEKTDKEKKQQKRRIRAAAAARTAGKFALKGAGKAAKLAYKGTYAATGATIGIAAGLASDNYANVLKYGAAGAGTFGAAASASLNIAKRPANFTKSVKSQYQAERDKAIKSSSTPSEYRDYKNAQADEKFLKDKEAKGYYKETFGEDNYKAAMKQAVEYRRHGVTDNETIASAMQVEGNFGKATDKKRIAIAKMASKVKNEKDIESVTKRLKEKGVNDDSVKEITTAIRQMKDLV